MNFGKKILQPNCFKIFLILFLTIIIIQEKLLAQTKIGFSTDVISTKNILREATKANRVIGRNITTESRSGSLPAQPYLFYDIDFSSYELLNANFTFSDKNSAQKIVFAPFKALDINDKYNLASSFRTNFAQKDGITTVGVSLGQDNSSVGSKRSKKYLEAFWDNNHVLNDFIDRIGNSKSDAELKQLDSLYKAELSTLPLLYNEAKLKAVFKWSISLNSQYFSVISTSGNTQKFDSANYYALKGIAFSASATYAINNYDFSIIGNYNRLSSRLSAAQDKEIIPYNGYSVNLNKRLFKFIPTDKLRKLDIYKKNLFVPAIHLGMSIESKTSLGDIRFSEDDARQKMVYTPYIDVYVSPASQFRLTLPISQFMRPNKETGIVTGIGVQYAFKIINLGE